MSSYDLASNPNNSSSNSYHQPSTGLLGTLPSARNNSSAYYNEPTQSPQQSRHQFQNQMFQPQPSVYTSSPPLAHSPSYNSQYPHTNHSPQQNTQSPSYKSPQSTSNYFTSGGYESKNYNQPLVIQASPPVPPPPPPPAFIPPPPPPMNVFSSQQSNKSWNSSSDFKSNTNNSSYESNTNFKSSETMSGNVVPDALLKSMHGSGKKPFTYTPGGLDLSHVKNSLRVKR